MTQDEYDSLDATLAGLNDEIAGHDAAIRLNPDDAEAHAKRKLASDQGYDIVTRYFNEIPNFRLAQTDFTPH